MFLSVVLNRLDVELVPYSEELFKRIGIIILGIVDTCNPKSFHLRSYLIERVVGYLLDYLCMKLIGTSINESTSYKVDE